MNVRSSQSLRAYVVLEVSPHGCQWRVVCCPFCGRPHWHGAGDDPTQARRFLGGRVSHCNPSCGGEYELVEAA
jgi:hypothetical protein